MKMSWRCSSEQSQAISCPTTGPDGASAAMSRIWRPILHFGASVSVRIHRQRGIGVWLACQPEDELPDGHNLLIECYKNPFDERCTVGLIVPWDYYGHDVAMARIHGGSGMIASFGFPARRLPEWRRMRDLSLSIEATVPSIRDPDYPSRNAALCAQIKQAIVERRNSLVESSAH